MKILCIESYPQVVFGQQRTLLSLLEEAGGRGHDCVVACTAEGIYTDLLREKGYPVEVFAYPQSLSSYGGAIYDYKGLAKLKCYGQGIGYVWGLRARLQRLQPDLVFCNDMRGLLTVGLAARSVGIPVVLWDKLDKPHGILDAFQLPIASANPIISQSVVVKYPQWQQKLYRKKISKIFNGVDVAKADSGVSVRESLPGEAGDVLIGIAGTITERKGHDRILKVLPQVLAQNPRVRLLVMGEVSGSNEDASFFEKLPNRDHPRVHWLGMRSDMPDIMQSIDMLVIPSRHEGMGQVTVEAMGARIPVVGARAGGIPEVIDDGVTGIVFDGDSEPQLIEAVLNLANDAELRQKMGAAGRLRAEQHFNRPLQMAKVVNLLEEVAGR